MVKKVLAPDALLVAPRCVGMLRKPSLVDRGQILFRQQPDDTSTEDTAALRNGMDCLMMQVYRLSTQNRHLVNNERGSNEACGPDSQLHAPLQWFQHKAKRNKAVGPLQLAILVKLTQGDPPQATQRD